MNREPQTNKGDTMEQKEQPKIRTVKCPWCNYEDKILDKPTENESSKVYEWQCSGCKGNIRIEFWK